LHWLAVLALTWPKVAITGLRPDSSCTDVFSRQSLSRKVSVICTVRASLIGGEWMLAYGGGGGALSLFARCALI
jgi:hypothetical protein